MFKIKKHILKSVAALLISFFIILPQISNAAPKTPGVKIPVLAYHHISAKVTNTMMVTPEKFEADMQAVKKAGYETITLNELVLALNGYKKLPEKPIIITFDDGYHSNYQYAYPVLKKMEMKAVINIVGWSVGRSKFINSDKAIYPHFNWEEAKEMIDSGLVEIQNHTYDLHSGEGKSLGYGLSCGTGVLPLKDEKYSEYKKRLTKDIVKNNQDIYDNTGFVPTFVAYPYGAYTKETEQALTEIGVIGTMTTNVGVRSFSDVKDLKRIPRLSVSMSKKGVELLEEINNLPLK